MSCSPCTRRDGPDRLSPSRADSRFSLHAQGWPVSDGTNGSCLVVLPARAGMALFIGASSSLFLCSPCTRRDGPDSQTPTWTPVPFSLHAQGWPVVVVVLVLVVVVLPARAGMSLSGTNSRARSGCSPCTRKDGPHHGLLISSVTKFSLHAQEWHCHRLISVSYG